MGADHKIIEIDAEIFRVKGEIAALQEKLTEMEQRRKERLDELLSIAEAHLRAPDVGLADER